MITGPPTGLFATIDTAPRPVNHWPVMINSQPWYRAAITLAPSPLRGVRRVQVAVVGGGLCGLAAALTAAEAGAETVLLEAGALADGGSGRNGGQVVPGWSRGAADLRQRYGDDRARALLILADQARAWLLATIARLAIDVDWQPHYLFAAIHQHHHADLDREVAAHAALGLPPPVLWDSRQISAAIGTARYGAALHYPDGGHLHPGRLCQGLAAAAIAAGAHLFCHSPVLRLTGSGPFELATPHGSLQAERVILACDAAAGQFHPSLAGRTLSLVSAVMATQPLATPPMAAPWAVADSAHQIDYFRQTGDGRLVYGGLARFDDRVPRDVVAALRRLLRRTYPALADTAVSHAWHGRIAATACRLPLLAEPVPGLFAALGFSGQGVCLAPYAGLLMARAAVLAHSLPDDWTTLPHRWVPQGALGRGIGALVGLWYGAVDGLLLATARRPR
ncbi:MAG: FAD-binding oxidoreductase [Alphaproteobacteria bacterium]|nr:FAD-binding oxidoreductase [Alphaproteobacteria bacterium]